MNFDDWQDETCDFALWLNLSLVSCKGRAAPSASGKAEKATRLYFVKPEKKSDKSIQPRSG